MFLFWKWFDCVKIKSSLHSENASDDAKKSTFSLISLLPCRPGNSKVNHILNPHWTDIYTYQFLIFPCSYASVLSVFPFLETWDKKKESKSQSMNKKLTNFPGLLKPRVSPHTFYNWLSLRKWSEVHCTGKESLCSRDSHYKQQQFTWANYPATFIWSWIYLILKKYIRGKEGSRESMDLPKRSQPALTTGSSVQPHTFPLGNCCRENGVPGSVSFFSHSSSLQTKAALSPESKLPKPRFLPTRTPFSSLLGEGRCSVAPSYWQFLKDSLPKAQSSCLPVLGREFSTSQPLSICK